jgi:undecaprenyl-diphosphatase
VNSVKNLAGAVARLPDHDAIARFDQSVDRYFEAHLRGGRALDLVMYAASGAGEHGLIWLAVAGLEGCRRGQGWRPLVRAGAALAAESALVNGLVKLGFQRQRPDRPEPSPLPLRTPRTSSFPSGHASSAFFAAALLRDSARWPVYYALAAVVATSRVHVRMHHASDVVAGAAVGALLGELARHLVPLSATPRAPVGTDRRPS